jgi:hypothetical protein
MKVHNLLVTGSLTSGGENITAISSSVSSTVTSLSSSVSTSIGGLSSSMASSMTSLSSSLTSSMGSLSSSMMTSMTNLSSSMVSVMATTGSNVFKGDQTISGSVIPAVNGSYDLGSPTNEFRHLYLSSASLYIDGTKVLGSTTQELQITTDAGQSFKILEAGSDTITLQAADGNITLATSGGGDVILDPTTGIIALKGTTTVYAGNKILSSDGNAIQFGNSVTMTGSLVVTGFIETQELRTTYISSSILYRSGSTKFGDELTDTHAFSGSVLISGSISVPGSNLVSGSAQITYSGLSGVPSGIISGSSQLPSGIVSGSAQIDVMSTTNIARLATTGSNTFTSNQIVTGSISSTGNIAAGTTFNWNGGIGALSYGTGVVTLETNTANAIQLKTNGTTAITINTGQTVNFSTSIGIRTSVFGEYLNIGNGGAIGWQNTSSAQKWHIQYNTSNDGLNFVESGVADYRLFLKAGGRVGINTQNPTVALQVSGTIASGDGDNGWGRFLYDAGTVKIQASKNGTDPIGISFWTQASGGAFSEKVSIAPGGNMGVGNFGGNAVSSLLELRNSEATLYDQTVDNGQDSNGVSLTIRNNDTSVVGSFSQINMQVSGDSGRALGRIVTIRMGSATSDMAFVTEDANVKAEKLRIASSGTLTSTGPGLIINRPASSSGEPFIFFNKDGTTRGSIYGGDGTAGLRFFSSVSTFSGNIMPSADATHNLGSTSLRWNNLYTTDLHLSNEGKQNIVDGTWGDWTLQEGEHDIFMLNNRSGEKFKIKLEKIIQ